MLAGLVGLSGCGFRPLYGPVSAADGNLEAELAAVRVGPVYERTGQLLRRSLQRRFEDTQPGTPARYMLSVAYDLGSEILGYRQDGGITRVRYTLMGTWNLSTMSTPPQRIAASSIPFRELDSFNIPDLQFFAADSSRDAALERLMDGLSDEIARQVALELRRRKESPAIG
jgi:LPS-assembly lipoprotein